MMPPTSIDGTDITGATIDGQHVQEITVDGDTVFTAVLDVPVSGLLHRYDASELTGETDGLNVDTFPDLAGGADLSRTGTVQYADAAINGLPALRTFGGGDGIMTGGTVLSQPFEVWFAMDILSTDGSNPQIFANAADFDVGLLPDRGGDYDLFAGTFLEDGPNTTGQQILTGVFDGANSEILKDNVSIVTGNAGSNGTPGGFILFNRRQAKSNIKALNAHFGEILIYDSADSGYSRSDVYNYLDAKWSWLLGVHVHHKFHKRPENVTFGVRRRPNPAGPKI